mmetsp:Transcript_102668/g.290344  ORF Transcript_102668/g.290344 Transcript_102668/m.290344 type:complete len:200 (-) Transcript_102668:141-740(-)
MAGDRLFQGHLLPSRQARPQDVRPARRAHDRGRGLEARAGGRGELRELPLVRDCGREGAVAGAPDRGPGDGQGLRPGQRRAGAPVVQPEPRAAHRQQPGLRVRGGHAREAGHGLRRGGLRADSRHASQGRGEAAACQRGAPEVERGHGHAAAGTARGGVEVRGWLHRGFALRHAGRHIAGYRLPLATPGLRVHRSNPAG